MPVPLAKSAGAHFAQTLDLAASTLPEAAPTLAADGMHMSLRPKLCSASLTLQLMALSVALRGWDGDPHVRRTHKAINSPLLCILPDTEAETCLTC